MTEKTYEYKNSAIRAARKAGLKDGEFEVKQVWEGKGKSHWEYVAKATAPVATESAVAEPVVESGAGEVNATTVPAEVTPKLVVQDYLDQPEPQPIPEALTAATPTEAQPKAKNKSTVANPTKAVWAIADEMKAANPAVTRKQVVGECVRRGVALYTARTQYQRWSKASADR